MAESALKELSVEELRAELDRRHAAEESRQISRDELKTMSPEAIVEAHRAGRLDEAIGKKAAKS